MEEETGLGGKGVVIDSTLEPVVSILLQDVDELYRIKDVSTKPRVSHARLRG